MLAFIALLIMKGLSIVAWGLLLALGFAWGNRLVPKIDELVAWAKGNQAVLA